MPTKTDTLMTPAGLRDWMTEHGWRTEQYGLDTMNFATAIGVSPRTVRAWLTGRNPIPRLLALGLRGLSHGGQAPGRSK